MKRLAAAWRRHPVLTGGFMLALGFTVLFAVRSIVFLVYWSDPAHHDRAFEDWMTPRYIARSWKLPDEVVLEALHLEQMPRRRTTLAEIATRQGVTVQQLEEDIARAALDYRAGYGAGRE